MEADHDESVHGVNIVNDRDMTEATSRPLQAAQQASHNGPEVSTAGTSRQRPSTPSRRAPSSRATTSRIPTCVSMVRKPARRSPTPSRTRASVAISDEAAAALLRTERLQLSTQQQTQVASAQADAAMEAARKAILETAAIRRTVKAALTAQF